ncbi:MAG: DUF4252 domain-containing protein [Bacteroidales bacterium]|nr:DUF4252 domain-containing protein [Bacteroidales bacterium]MDD3890851.1 DUF4252 domain-containing protein [Bacteroidales bacterium]
MRTITLVISLFLLVTNAFSQSPIDKAFSQYSGKPGFTSVSITPELFQLLSMVDAKDEELKQLSEKITSLKILVSEDKAAGFTNEIRKQMVGLNYKTIMQIADGEQKVDFFVKQNGEMITDLVMVAIDKTEEVLISLSGNISLQELSNLGSSSGKIGMSHISLLKSLEE